MRSLAVLALSGAFALHAFAERHPRLPEPYATPSIGKGARVTGWPRGRTPTAPQGFDVSALVSLRGARSLYLMPEGDVLVSCPGEAGGSNAITRLRLRGSDLLGTETFLSGLRNPFGMALWKDEFFVAEPGRVLKFKYENGHVKGEPQVIAQLPFPKPQHHWTRHLLLSPDGSKLYVAVGSASNVGEAPDPLDPRNAAILEMDRDGSHQRIFAGGLRNPVSMAWEPVKGRLWTVVNERDLLGDDLPPDYITHVEDGGFYGWPYSYWGKHVDPRRRGEHPELVQRALEPDFAIGAHTAGLGIAFTAGTRVPAPYNNGAFVTEHGSWNRSKLSGYKVSYVPFQNGEAVDGERDFLTGFLANANDAYGRPVASLILGDGSVLVSDDGGGKIWRVRPRR